MQRYIGLMSGTSLDAVDAVLLEPDNKPVRIIASASAAIPEQLRSALVWLSNQHCDSSHHGKDAIDTLGWARRELSQCYGQAVDALGTGALEHVRAIGAHGQTIRHRPEQGYSLQILDGALLARLSQRVVVCDFRSADIAAHGQGAPLVPAFHAHAFGHPTQASAVINIGGIANATVLSVAASRVLAGFDTGPGNRLMDDWSKQHQQTAFDKDGLWADSGEVNAEFLATLMDDPFFSRAAPKSTGREDFNIAWLDAKLAAFGRSVSTRDVQASLLELTAQSIWQSMRAFDIDRVLVCGGGAKNRALMRRLGQLFEPAVCTDTLVDGIAPQDVEAAAFGWLAMRRIHELAGNLPSASGADAPCVLGCIYPAN